VSVCCVSLYLSGLVILVLGWLACYAPFASAGFGGWARGVFLLVVNGIYLWIDDGSNAFGDGVRDVSLDVDG
jgi:hypothetical protein